MNRLTIWGLIKKLVIWVVCLPLVVIVSFVLVQYLKISLKPYQVTCEPITVHQTRMNNNNMYQNNAEVVIFSVNGTLHYFVKNWPGSLGLRSRFSGKLCTMENRKINVLQDASKYYGNDNRYIYYQSDNRIMAYDTQFEEASILAQLTEYEKYNALMHPDGTLIFYPKDKNMECFSVKNGRILEPNGSLSAPLQYILGGDRYTIEKRKIYRQGEDISDQFGEASFRAIVPYQEGLLVINDGYGNPVYYIQEDGAILDLFPEFMCMCSESSINFYEHFIFVSFLRWEDWDESGLGMKRFENDQLAGTYRIDIRNFSVEKISDHIYSGMYIFDDSGIYTCSRDGDISKISFSGEELQRIVD